MKKIAISIILFLGLTQKTEAQNLQFNQAVYYTYGPGNADGVNNTPSFTGQLVVNPNQVLKITYVSNTSLNASSGGTTLVSGGFISINDFAFTSGPIDTAWLPAGTYTVKGFDTFTSGSFRGLINGILYDIVP